MKDSVERLYSSFKPSKYNLTVTTDDKNMTFSGSVVIVGALTSPSKTLKLHSSELKITRAVINNSIVTVKTDEKAQTIELTSENTMSGKLIVEIGFSGTITKPMHGLYPCYFEHEGIEKMLFATQFESHHAREVFPCIDEPEAKAIFSLIIGARDNDVVVSNSPEARKWQENGVYYTEFEKTPLMSTYLLAWVAGELLFEEATTDHGVKVRSYATPVHRGKTAYGLEVAVKALDYMDDYFDIPYPLPKCDIVALPDFAAGAMENWGCITFRESAMLVDPVHSDLSDKQHVADVVTHELAHQWFGNLVTMRWWEDLWLNEGFASWVPYLVLNDLYPEWKVWEQFSTGDLMIGLRADALHNTHPIVVEIRNPNEIRSAFDSISYDKGCSVINLLHKYIGADAFRDGLRQYLKDHAYSNAETADLWAAWSKSSGKDVEGFMRAWTTEKGFPIISVKKESTGATLLQERFFLDKDEETNTQTWPIPLMRSAYDTAVLDTKSISLDSVSKLNKGQSGFYRAIYDDASTKEILKGNLDPIDLLGLINDASEAAKAGYHSTTKALSLLSEVSRSENEALLSTALGELAGIRTVLPATFEPMKPFVLSFIDYNLNRLGKEASKNDTVDDELLRPMILGAASYAGNAEIIEWALGLFTSAKTPEDIRPDLRSVVYNTAVRENGDIDTYNKLYSWYQRNTIPGERTSLAGALVGFKDPEIINKSLSVITSDDVKLQDALYWIAYSLTGRHSKLYAWEWLKANWGWIGSSFGKEKEIDYYLRYASNGFATREHLEDYTAFFSGVDIYGSNRAFEQGKETISWQTKWRTRDEEVVSEYFKSL